MRQNCQINQWFQNDFLLPSRIIFEQDGAEPAVERTSEKKLEAPAVSEVRQDVSETLEETKNLEEKIERLERENKELRTKLAEREAALEKSDLEVVELKSLVRVDPVTRALTRRALEKELQVRIKKIDGSRERGRRSSESHHFSILFVDIDHFKQINDTLGHDIGDATLKEFIELLKANLRDSDLIGKYGGEEFIVILEGASEEDAAKKAEALRQTVQDQLKTLILGHCPDEKDKVEALRGGTMSVGVASYSTDSPTDLSMEELMKRADQAMYHSKNNGRNRVTVYDPDTIDPKDEEMAEKDTES